MGKKLNEHKNEWMPKYNIKLYVIKCLDRKKLFIKWKQIFQFAINSQHIEHMTVLDISFVPVAEREEKAIRFLFQSDNRI